MKLLADENFRGPVVDALVRQGHDVLRARVDCPAAKDGALINRAESEGRIILTLDRDFWQLALQRPGALKQSGFVLFRVHPAIPENLEPLVRSMLRARHEWIGHVSIVTPDGIEIIPAKGE
jgi:predicted nuclease of predicted toxin-antitoxin system